MYSKEIFPLLFLLFLIKTFKPILLDTDISRSFILASFTLLGFCLLFLNILTKLSACLTESFFSTILLATKDEFSNPTKILA